MVWKRTQENLYHRANVPLQVKMVFTGRQETLQTTSFERVEQLVCFWLPPPPSPSHVEPLTKKHRRFTKRCRLSCLNNSALVYELKVTMSRDFLLLVFFMNQFPPSPRVSHWDRFKFFRKIAEIIASKGAPPVSATPVANLPPVSTTPAAKLPPVSTTAAANFATSFASVVDTGGK